MSVSHTACAQDLYGTCKDTRTYINTTGIKNVRLFTQIRLFSARETKTKSLTVLFCFLDRDLGWFQTGMTSELSSHPHSHCLSIHLKSLCDIISINWVAWLAVNSLMEPLHGEG